MTKWSLHDLILAFISNLSSSVAEHSQNECESSISEYALTHTNCRVAASALLFLDVQFATVLGLLSTAVKWQSFELLGNART